jgi:aminotransferase class V
MKSPLPRIYLDYNASTPIDPAVVAAMQPYLTEHFGNTPSGHWAAEGAKAALENARGKVATLLGAERDEIIFTSGGSEECLSKLVLFGERSLRRALRQYVEHSMPSEIIRGRAMSCCSLAIRISAAGRSLFNAASDWVGSCAITIKRRRDRTPKVQSWNTDFAILRAAIGRSRKSRKPLCYPSPQRCALASSITCEVQVLPPFEFFGHTRSRSATNSARSTRYQAFAAIIIRPIGSL